MRSRELDRDARRLGAAMLAAAGVLAAVACRPSVLNPRLEDNPKELRLFLPVEQFQLDNGLRVAILPEKTTNLVQVDVRYTVGSMSDPIGREGLAHVVEHLQYTKRATDHPSALIGEIQTDISLSHNAYTALDYTHYTATALSDQIEPLLKLERDRLATGCDSISDEAIEREVAVVQQELRQRGIATHDALAELRTLFYGPKHAYSRAIGGTEASVARIGRGDVCGFLARHYGPKNAILIINGNVNRFDVIKLIGSLFNPIPRRPLASSPTPTPFKPSTKTKTAKTTDTRPVLLATYLRPSWHSNTGVVARIIDRYAMAKLEQLEKVDWIHDAGLGHPGGNEAPIAVVYLELEDESHFEEAKKLLEKTIETPVTLSRWSLEGFQRTEQALVLRAFEPFYNRSQRVADDIQFGENRRLIVRDLGVLKHLKWTMLMALGAELFSSPTFAELRVAKSKTEKTVTKKDIERSGMRPEFDLESWRRPVDPAEANRALVMPPAPPAPKVQKTTLENGVRLVFVPSSAFPLVDIRVLIGAGSAHEPEDKPGVARFAAELLTPSYRYKPGRRVAGELRRIAETGYLLNTEVGRDSTTLHARGLSPHVRAFLWLLYYNLQNGKYNNNIVDILSRSGTLDSDEEKRSSQLLAVLLGADHPFVRARKRVGKIRASDLERFRKKHYKTESMTVIVTGNFETADVASEAARLFAAIRGAGAKPPPPPPTRARGNTSPVYLGIADRDADQLRISIGLVATPGFEPYARREVLAEILRSRLMALRSRLAVTYGITVLPITTRDLGLVFVTTLVDASMSPDVLAQIKRELETVAKGTDIAADFTRARRKVFETALAATVDSDQLADQIEFALTHGLDFNYRRARARQVAELTFDKFRAELASELPLSRVVVELEGKRGAIKSAFSAAGIVNARIRDKPKPAAKKSAAKK